MKRLHRFGGSALIIFTVILSLYSRPGRAEGAIAVAHPPDVANEGFSSGTAFNYGTVEEANGSALDRCRSSTKDEARRALCKVIQTFHHQCVAVAMDPKDGTPGVGWAVAAGLEDAQAVAMADCHAT